jgi:hypothetical protein
LSASTESREKLVLVVDRLDTPALELLRYVVGETFRQLQGLFIEDAQMLEHARSRLAREVLLSGIDRPLEAAALRGQLRAQAARARQLVEASAAELGLPFSFRVAKGEPLEELRRAAAEADSLVVSLSSETEETCVRWRATVEQLGRSPIRTLLIVRRGWLTGNAILAVLEEPEDAARILAVAKRLGERSRSPLTMLVRGTGKKESDPLGGMAQLGSKVTAAPSKIRIVETLDPAALVSAARQERARLVVLPWRDRPNQAELFHQLMRKAGSAILLVK